MKTAAQVREEFIEFFVRHGHTAVPSAPVVPHDDPTLMFTNAGMNQFKDVFLATGSRPYTRAVDTQKCIRVSGKHNDLEEVGRDTYHHTFFEMLGNWSFGDYFKREAIQWAWSLLTEVWGLPKSRLYATVFGGDAHDRLDADEDAARLWTEVTDIDASHIRRFGRKDNFWEMGETGPCGPCSEIHIDLSPDGGCGDLVNAGDPRVIEIWNLVFIQFNRDEGGRLAPLPAQHVDTGMGFERIVRVLQGKNSNYDTDVFTPLLSRIAQLTGRRYAGNVGLDAHVDNAFRVIADHIRMLTFAINDGARPGNDGRGYVVRRILRRAARFGRQFLEQSQPFLHALVPTVVETMSGPFPELQSNPQRIIDVIRDEEESFGRTLDRGIALFAEAARRAESSRVIDGEDAFKLYDTFGFPFDLTTQMAAERGLGVDEAGFNERMAEAKRKARESAKKHVTFAFDGELPATDDQPKHDGRETSAVVVGWLKENRLVREGRLSAADGEVGLVLDRTCFYAEQGGQVGDTGLLVAASGTFEVDDTTRLGGGILHVGRVTGGQIEAGQPVRAAVSEDRDDIRRNHTATHLLHWALRTVLGDHVIQHGSVVAVDRLRFDFDHNQALTADQIAAVERLVNERIRLDLPLATREMPTEEAKNLPGVRAFFGDKYGDVVRVVEIGDGFSREFCGGTHLSRTGEAGFFKIVGEEAVAKGIRRIIAVTGRAAVEHVQRLERTVREAAGLLNTGPDQLSARIGQIQDEIKDLRRQLQRGVAADLKTHRQRLLDAAARIGETRVIIGEMPVVAVEQLRETADWLRTEARSAVVLLGMNGEDQKPLVLAAVTADLVKKGLHAGNLVKEIAPLIDGRGGGKPDLAQAGGKNAAGLAAALAKGAELLRARLP